MLHLAHMPETARVNLPWVKTVVETSRSIGDKLECIRSRAGLDAELLEMIDQIIADNEANREFAVQQACLHYSEIIQDLSEQEIAKIQEWNSSLPLFL